MKKFNAIIFDLDGTLVNSINDLADAMNFVLKANKLPTHNTETYKRFVGNGIRKLVERALPKHLQMTKDVDIFYQQMLHYYNEHCIDKTHPYNGILELLDFLKQKQLAICILSNKADELTKKIAKNLFKENTFDIVQGAIPTIPRKPNPAAAVNIAKQLNINCHKILYIGDTNIDIETAKKAGMFAVGCTWGFRTKEELENAGADLIIDHASDLINFFKD